MEFIQMTVFLNTIAMVLTIFAVYGWFNPKNRYNEHLNWEPEHFLIWFIILIIWAGILI
jgi:hypothetical protein